MTGARYALLNVRWGWGDAMCISPGHKLLRSLPLSSLRKFTRCLGVGALIIPYMWAGIYKQVQNIISSYS